MASCIYCIENKINGKKYIGRTCNFAARKASHTSYLNKGQHYNEHLQRSWNKYGKENFEFYIVENEIPDKIINQKEIKYIKKYNTFKGEGYNLCRGGEGYPSGENHPMYGKKRSEEYIESISGENHWFYGKKHTEESKKLISKNKSGENNQYYGKRREESFSKKMSKITKQQAIDIYYKYKNTDLTQAEIAKDYPITGRQVSDITRGKHYATRNLEGGGCY